MKIAIVTDTNSGISKQEAEKYGIYLIPMPVIIDDKIYYENKNISAEEFYHFLNSDKNVSTSQPSPGDIMTCGINYFQKINMIQLYIFLCPAALVNLVKSLCH